MKKLSVISGIVFAAFILYAVTLFNPESASNQPTHLDIKVYVIGCDDCDNITYCIDGGPTITVNSSSFVAQYEDDGTPSHNICIHCCGKAGNASFNTYDPKTKVVVSNVGADCICGDKKKK
jgi:hypothetical protein